MCNITSRNLVLNNFDNVLAFTIWKIFPTVLHRRPQTSLLYVYFDELIVSTVTGNKLKYLKAGGRVSSYLFSLPRKSQLRLQARIQQKPMITTWMLSTISDTV